MQRTLFTAVALIAALAAPARPQNHVKEFAQDVKARLATLKGELLDLDAQFATDIDAMQDSYLNGTQDAVDTHLALFDRLVALDDDVAAALRTCTDGVEADASGHLQAALLFANAFAVGDGGVIDDALHKAVKLRVKSTTGNFKKVHKLAVLMKIIDKYDLIVDRRGQVVEPMTPSDVVGEEAPAAAKMLRVDLLLAGSAKPGDADGLMCLAGTANTTGTDHVDVTIERPGDAPVVLTAGIDPATGRWERIFEALPEGNYAISVSHDGVEVSDSLAVQ